LKEKQYFKYGDSEIHYLKSKDPALGKVIDNIGHVYREVIPDMFMALANSIIGQQISTKAQETIWTRFLEMFAPATPEHIASLSVETVQTCGISMKKALYIHEIATTVLDGSLDLEKLQGMSDEDVSKRLSQIKGVGVWTAEMLMIFSMQRKDVISQGDMAIIRGLRMLYRHRKITPQLFSKYKKRYSPYASIASFYLWQISHGACDGLVDFAPKPEARKKGTDKTDKG
jgi:DNA-3-methyladenine glycosylase II